MSASNSQVLTAPKQLTKVMTQESRELELKQSAEPHARFTTTPNWRISRTLVMFRGVDEGS
eukprot:3121758-Amphidinium_carterae.1